MAASCRILSLLVACSVAVRRCVEIVLCVSVYYSCLSFAFALSRFVLALRGVFMRRMMVAWSLHELLFGAVRAENVVLVGNETLADEGAAAHRADEALVMPVAILKRNKAGAADSCNNKKSRRTNKQKR